MTAIVASPGGRNAARLAELRRYCILDTEPERDFDALAALAAELCGTPIALITLVDGERLWFKSHFGLDVSEVSLADSFCGRLYESGDEALIVGDARGDERFAGNPMVAGAPYVRFYAGVPLRSRDGLVLGSLCVLDYTARMLSGGQASALRVLADQAMAQIELRRNAFDARERLDALAASRLDLRESHRENKFLRHANDHDALTGLYSRARFERAVEEKLDCRGPGAVVVLDIDDFHDVNESYGVAAGNLVLCAVAKIVSGIAPDALAARLYADKFALLIECADPAEVRKLAHRLIGSFGKPFQIGPEAVWISASAGVAHASELHANIVADADTALKRARGAGGATYCVYTSELNEVSVARAAIRDNLHEAIAQQQFELYYQPKVDLRTARVVGCEALIRWHHPQHGFQSPASFIPVAEQTGLIVPIGEWVIREACRQYVAWQREGVPVVPIAVNVSAAQFARSDVINVITRTSAEFGLPPKALEIELTEGMLLECSDDLVRNMKALRASGIGIALDDFGTGFSSLGYLHRLPLSLLKVDQTFVRGAATNSSDTAIVRSIVHLARQLGLRTVAEGVETDEQLALVVRWGCDEAQGYLFSKPVRASEFTQFLHSGQHVLEAKCAAARDAHASKTPSRPFYVQHA